MNSKWKQFIFTILLGTLCCVVLGVLGYGFTIFKMNDIRFVIILFGFYGSIFLGSINYLRLKEIIISVLFVILFSIIIRGKTTHLILYLRDIYLLMPLFLSIYLYKYFLNKYTSVPLFVRGLSLVLLFPVFYLIFLLLLVWMLGFNLNSNLAGMFISFRLSILVALGLAISFDLYEKFRMKINSLLKVE